MPDELPGEETGAQVVSESTTDWEQRYKDTHANWNSLNERMSRFEKDPNALIEFIQEKHPDLLAEEDEPEDTYEEPDEDEQPLTRAEWKQWQAEQAQAAQANAARRATSRAPTISRRRSRTGSNTRTGSGRPRSRSLASRTSPPTGRPQPKFPTGAA
jgi:chromosome segregation ATPase